MNNLGSFFQTASAPFNGSDLFRWLPVNYDWFICSFHTIELYLSFNILSLHGYLSLTLILYYKYFLKKGKGF